MSRADERSAIFALIAWVVALATDFLDGPIARRRGTVSALSGAFDHTSDFLFVVSGIFAGAYRGAFPWILPVCIAAAFAQYAIDSYWFHRQIRFRGSKLGRYNGMLYFAPPIVDILIRLGARVAAAVAYDFGVGTGFEHAGIHGPALHVQQIRLCRTPPESLAGEIAGRLRH